MREEYGYPIMVTPLAQFVGTQAAVNVMAGERYKEVTDQSIQYALGYWGEEGARLMDPEVKDKILSRPRAREWENWTWPEPSPDEVRQKFGGPGVSDEELVIRVIAGPDSVNAMLAAGAPKEFLDARRPRLPAPEAARGHPGAPAGPHPAGRSVVADGAEGRLMEAGPAAGHA